MDELDTRPEWANCVVLRCTRCGTSTKVSWEVFSEASQFVYQQNDMPQYQLLPYDCWCGREELHFVDLDASYLRPGKVRRKAEDRGARVCGCRECKRR